MLPRLIKNLACRRPFSFFGPVLVLILPLFLSPSLAKDAEIVEASVAKVGDRIIFLSEVRDEWRLERVLKGELARAGQAGISDQELERTLRWKINQTVIMVYLDKLGLWKDAPEKQLEQIEKKFAGKFPAQANYEKFLERIGLPRARLLNYLWERKRAELFVEERLQNKPARSGQDVDQFVGQEKQHIGVELLPWKPKQQKQEK